MNTKTLLRKINANLPDFLTEANKYGDLGANTLEIELEGDDVIISVVLTPEPSTGKRPILAEAVITKDREKFDDITLGELVGY